MASLTFITNVSNGGSSAGPVSYGTVTYGAGFNALLIGITAPRSAGAPTVTAVSVGGSAATQIPGAANAPNTCTDIWQFNTPVGTSANITVTYSDAAVGSDIFVYGLVSTTLTNSGASGSQAFGPTVTSGSITIPAGGAAFAVTTTDSGGGVSFTWTNATQDAADTPNSCASATVTTTGTTTVSASDIGNNLSWGISVAAFSLTGATIALQSQICM